MSIYLVHTIYTPDLCTLLADRPAEDLLIVLEHFTLGPLQASSRGGQGHYVIRLQHCHGQTGRVHWQASLALELAHAAVACAT